MKKFVKVFLALALVAIMVTTFVACAGKNKVSTNYRDFFKQKESEKLNFTNAESFTLDGVSNIEFLDDEFISYTKDGKYLCIYDLNTQKEIIAGDENYTDVKIFEKDYDLILITRYIDGVRSAAVFSKNGEKYLDFSQSIYTNYSYIRGVKDNIFVIDGDVYKGSELIIESNYSINNFEIIGDKIVYQDSGNIIFWDLNGNIINSIFASPDNISIVQFFVLSDNKVLIQTSYMMPEYTNDYTYLEGTLEGTMKVKVVNEIFDINSGKKSVINLNYVVMEAILVSEINGDDDIELSEFTDAAQDYAVVIAYEIKNKLVNSTSTMMFVDENLNIKGRFENSLAAAILSKDRLMAQDSDGIISFTDNNGKVLRVVNDNIIYIDPDVGLVGGVDYSQLHVQRYYNFDGKKVIDSKDYYDIAPMFVGDYVLAYKQVIEEEVPTIVFGRIDKNGEFEKLADTDMLADGLLAIYLDEGNEKAIIKNPNGDTIKELAYADYDIFDYDSRAYITTSSACAYGYVKNISSDSYTIFKISAQ